MTTVTNNGERPAEPVEVDAASYVGWCPFCSSDQWRPVETGGVTSRVVPECFMCQQIHPGVLFRRGTDPHHEARHVILDCRGIQLRESAQVVLAGASGRLLTARVLGFDFQERPSWWVNVRISPGGSTTPDRLAVVA